MKTLATALALAVLAAAPAAARAQETPPAPATPAAPAAPARSARVDRNVLTTEQIVAANKNTLYEVIQSTRPAWLRTRGRATSGGVKVYLDGIRQGSAGSLRDLDPANVARVQYLDASNATTQYGTDHTEGAIMVTTRRG